MPPTHFVSSERLMEFLAHGARLPPLSPLGRGVLGLAGLASENINVSQLAEMVGSDPALAARLLRVANSAHWGVSRRVTSVRHAIALLGVREALSHLSHAVLRGTMRERPKTKHFSLDRFWIHSWCCARVARALGHPRFLIRTLPGDLHMAGLLHDLGELVMALQLPDEVDFCHEAARQQGTPLWEVERQVLGFDHTRAGFTTFPLAFCLILLQLEGPEVVTNGPSRGCSDR